MFTNMEYQVYSWSSAFGILGMIKDVFVQKFAIAIISCCEMLDEPVSQFTIQVVCVFPLLKYISVEVQGVKAQLAQFVPIARTA